MLDLTSVLLCFLFFIIGFALHGLLYTSDDPEITVVKIPKEAIEEIFYDEEDE